MATKKPTEVRTRIAPSPTGYLHIGTARTTLFNWLFAKKQGGKFILRIEDTDLERSDPKFEKDIIESLKWLGLNWDEGPHRQSERLDSYKKYIKKLLETGQAYYCFCGKEELEEQRQAMLSQGLAPKYSGKCRILEAAEVKKRLQSNEASVIRFKIPETKISFNDLIRGEISFDGSLIGDIAIAKNPQTPLYNFAVVIDDYEMEISHVIRGEDHLANTPKQIFIQQALDFPRPQYAHLPLILDPDRSKMSKRYAATAIAEYRQQGYLPEALINFMALLGWHPASLEDEGKRGGGRGTVSEREIFSPEELIQLFDLKRIQKAGAVFNIEKLDWINSQYIKRLNDEELAKMLKAENLKAVALVRDRMKKLSDFAELADFIFELPDYRPELLIWKDTVKSAIVENLQEVEKILNEISDKEFTKENLEKHLMILAERKGRGEILWPLRAALSGKDASPGPFEIADVLGKKETLKRIEIAIEKLRK